jgi:tight adherence protein C
LVAVGGFALSNIGAAPNSLPWAMRVMWRPAGMVMIPIAAVLPTSASNSLQRDLARCDLDDALTPERWLALRLLHGLLALAAGSLVAGVIALPEGVPEVVLSVLGFCWGGQWLRRRRTRHATAILRQLPAYLDVLTLSVESGASLTTGLRLAVEKSTPGPLRQVFGRVLREIRSGRTRVEAFARVAEVYDLESLSALTSALIHSEGAGMSLGAVLRAQSQQRTAERFATAERLAMQAPVKMLGPLILCIFPCTFIVIAVPIVVRLLGATSQ